MDELHRIFLTMRRRPQRATLFPYTTLFRSGGDRGRNADQSLGACAGAVGSGRMGGAGECTSVGRWARMGTTATKSTEAAAELERGADGSRRVVRREMGSDPGSARPLGAGVGIVFGPPDLRAASGRVGIRSGRNGLRGSECGDQAL